MASMTTLHPDVVTRARMIVNDVRDRGEAAVREYAGQFDGLGPGCALVIPRAELEAALDALPPDDRRRLTRVAARIRAFAEGQRRALAPFEMPIPGGRAGHVVAPVASAGCYAPGGRYPLPSSVLMTAITARSAGVDKVWVASPRRDPIMLASAALAGADGFLGVGGAQAIAALAFGLGDLAPSDIVVGPGNAYVTAAKRAVFGHVGIDSLAGPSELVVVGDAQSDAGDIAADLLAQAEHDPDALPILVSIGEPLASRVTMEIGRQLETLPTADVAREALHHGGVIVADTIDDAIETCNALAPEHLHVHAQVDGRTLGRFRHYGALFIGKSSAETSGDYGAGPNHVLPTGRAARYAGGLSVLTFLRVRTWLEIDDPIAADELYADAAWLGRIEGLEAHARASERRIDSEPGFVPREDLHGSRQLQRE
jgi:phosphoribosyl-ATP pyrophosphohydrolase/phosphoribosyl-AMP cyclohydrolase/histidinol dehydrogenase